MDLPMEDLNHIKVLPEKKGTAKWLAKEFAELQDYGRQQSVVAKYARGQDLYYNRYLG
jgi:hypothetical protein